MKLLSCRFLGDQLPSKGCEGCAGNVHLRRWKCLAPNIGTTTAAKCEDCEVYQRNPNHIDRDTPLEKMIGVLDASVPDVPGWQGWPVVWEAYKVLFILAWTDAPDPPKDARPTIFRETPWSYMLRPRAWEWWELPPQLIKSAEKVSVPRKACARPLAMLRWLNAHPFWAYNPKGLGIPNVAVARVLCWRKAGMGYIGPNELQRPAEMPDRIRQP